MASAGPYASQHVAPDRQPRQHPTAPFFTGRMPFLPPNQQCQSTEGNSKHWRQTQTPRVLCHLEFPSTPCSIKISYRLTELLPGVWCLPFYRDTVYYDPQHLPCSIYVLDSPFLQPLSKSNRHKFKNCSHLCMHQCAYTAQSSYHYLPS